MASTLDLARYTENDDDDDGGDDPLPLSADPTQAKKHNKRAEWAKGKSRAQPSENWDDDFLFGAVSSESLPLPHKSATRSPSSPPNRKPGSARQPNSLLDNLPASRSSHSTQPLRSSKNPSDLRLSKPRNTNSISQERENDPTDVSRHPDTNSLTPRKKPSVSHAHSPRPHLSVPPSLSSSRSSQSSRPTPPFSPPLPSPNSTLASGSAHLTLRPPPARPPCSAPASRSSTSTQPLQPPLELNHRGHTPDSGSQELVITKERKPTISSRKSQPSRPPVSLRRRPPSHKAVSSQDSVPSISDFSSVGVRSPSSSLSMTDDSRGDRSHSSGDYSAGFDGGGRGNRSFHTETECTEPETELDWGDDTDLDNRSSCSPLHLSTRPDRPSLISKPTPLTIKPLTASDRLSSSGSAGPYPGHISRAVSSPRPSCLAFDSQTYSPELDDVTSLPTVQSSKTTGPNHYRRSAHSSFDSQSTFTSVRSSKSRHAVQSTSAASSSSSIGYYKSNNSDASLSSSLSRMSCNNQMTGKNLSQNHEAYLSRQQARTPSLSSTSSHFPLPHQGYSSDSHEAPASGTETDGLSDRVNIYVRQSPVQSTSACSSTWVTPNATQRSRKQALYARPAYVDTGSSISSLANSLSCSTLNSSSRHPSDPLAAADDEESDTILYSPPAVEDEGKLKNLRRKLKKKRPSVLALNPSATAPSSSIAVTRKPSVAESIYSDHQLSGDLAFAADSDDDSRCQHRTTSRTASNAPGSPFELVDRSDIISISLRSPTPVAPRRGMSMRNSSGASTPGVPRQATVAATPVPVAQDTSLPDQGKLSQKFKSRRPLSFTALLSRNSMTSLAPAQPSSTVGGNRHVKTSGHATSIVSGLFVRKSTETVRDALSTDVFSSSARPSSPSDMPPPGDRPIRGHFRQAASIGSNPSIYPRPQSSGLEPSESFMSRVRRLSSRQSSRKGTPPPTTPTRKRFSIIGGTSSSSRLGPSPPTSTPQAPSAASTPSHRRNQRSPTVVIRPALPASVTDGIIVSDDPAATLRARRPSSRESSSNSRLSGLLRGNSLRRRFSASSNNKAPIYEPNLSISPPAAPLPILDHNLKQSLASSQPRSRSLGNSKPPKSNPALRRKAAASVSATLDHYRMASPPASRSEVSSAVTSPMSPDFQTALNHPRQLSIRATDASTSAPCSEPLPEQPLLPNHTTPALPASTGPLGRSNSMGELRIPSRITSQQGRLHTELNQMKEFARGIDDLKSMRRHYRKLIESVTHPTPSPATTDDEVESTTEPSSDGECVHPSPRALARLSTVIARIEGTYREWWTCCNVLIDLGDGETDPRARFSPERIRAFSCNPSSSRAGSGSPPDAHHRHFEILKNMFGPAGERSSPPRAIKTVASFDRTPMRLAAPEVVMTPETPTAMSWRRDEDKSFEQSFTIDDDEDDSMLGLDDGSVKGKQMRAREGLVSSPVQDSSSTTSRKSNKLVKKKSKSRNERRLTAPLPESKSSLCSLGSDKRKTGRKSLNDRPDSRVSSSGQSMLTGSESRKSLGRSARFGSSGPARTALQGVKDFLRTFKAKMIQDERLAAQQQHQHTGHHHKADRTSSIPAVTEPGTSSSPSSSPPPSEGSRSSSSEECWDDDILLERTTTIEGGGAGGAGTAKRLALSSERMPQLLNYLAIVRHQCQACLDELRCSTV